MAANSIAVLAALYIAFALELERPYWAMFSVFIVANPLSGAVRSRAAYRLLGTIIGASAALIMIPPLVQEPPLLCLAMAAWVGVCLWLSLLDTTPRSYVPMLAGYTATIVGLSVVNAPETIFDTAVTRVEEIGIGVICGAVAHSVIFPRNVGAALNDRIALTLRACADWTSHLLSDPEAREESVSQRLAQCVAEIHTLNTHVAFDTSDVPRTSRQIQTLQDRLALILAHLTSAQLAIDAVRARGKIPDPLSALMDPIIRWIRSVAVAPDVLGVADLRPHFVLASSAAQVPDGTRNDDDAALAQIAASHLLTLVAALDEVLQLARAIRDDKIALTPELAQEVHAARPVSLHRDAGLALVSAGAAVIAVLVACAMWIGGSWPEGAVAAQFAAIGCSFFATLDKPSARLGSALTGVLIALPVGALYQFAVLPRVDGFVSLALVLSPLLLLFSFMQTVPKLAGAALVLGITFSGALALQPQYQADFPVFLNTSLAEIVGLLVALTVNLIFRTFDPVWNAQRISRAGWRAIVALVESGSGCARGWPTQMLDRAGQILTRLGSVNAPCAANAESSLLRDLRVAVHITAIRAAEKQLDSALAPRLNAIRHAIACIYRARWQKTSAPTAATLASSIDDGIAALNLQPRSASQIRALAGLAALRADLAEHP